jgi:hypothetical protein
VYASFFINLPIGGIALGLILLLFKPPSSAKPVAASWKEIFLQLDLPGTFVILASLVCFLLATQWSGVTRAWDSPSVIALWALFGGLVLAFIAIQIWQKERAALVPRILGQQAIAGVCAFAFLYDPSSKVQLILVLTGPTSQNGTNFLVTYYLPLYFQAIDGASATQSGIYNLPLILGSCEFHLYYPPCVPPRTFPSPDTELTIPQGLCAALSGILIVRVGYYTPFMVFGSALFMIGAGLLYTLNISTPLAYTIGYQVLLGVGQGIGIQMAVITGQAYSRPEDLSATTAIVLCKCSLQGLNHLPVSPG